MLVSTNTAKDKPSHHILKTFNHICVSRLYSHFVDNTVCLWIFSIKNPNLQRLSLLMLKKTIKHLSIKFILVWPDGGYSSCGSFGNRGDMALLDTKKVGHRFGCTLECNLNEQCMGYNVNNVTMECQLISADQLIQTVQDANWKMYIKCLQGLSRCIHCT